jgi:hypothetical protein
MQVTVTKITDYELMNEACGTTIGKENTSPDPLSIYKAEHSPIRTQMFKVNMVGIPTFVSAHFVRHKIGVEHFVKSNREDRKGDGEANRLTSVNHLFHANAQALINMARKRLCFMAHRTAREVMAHIRQGVSEHDLPLAHAMVPDCIYRGCVCYELRCCRNIPHIVHWKDKGAPAWGWNNAAHSEEE